MKHLQNTLITALVCLIGVDFCVSHKWELIFRGQNVMFLSDWDYVKDILLHPGGLAELVSKFLIQFFTVPGIGVATTLVLLGLNAWMVWKIMERTAVTGERVEGSGHFDRLSAQDRLGDRDKFGGSDKAGDQDILGIFPFCLLPSIFLAASLFDCYCFYQGIVAYVAAVFCLLEYSRIKKSQLLWGSVMTVGLFFLTGPVALLFAVRALLFDIFVKRPKALLSVIYPVITFILGFAMIQTGQIATVLDAFTPRMYYETGILRMPEIHYVSWVMLSVCIFIAAASRKIKINGKWGKLAVCLTSAVVTLLTFGYLNDTYRPDRRERLYRLECLATNDNWDEIIRLHGKDVRSQNEANYLNLALAEKGRLAEDLFKYRQNGPASLINDVKAQNDMSLLRLSRILFAMGNMSAAQDMAFNSDQAFGDHVPSMLKMILEIDLMRGSYLTAEKYIHLMEKSLLNSRWAASQRRFLWNDKAVEKDELLGNGRRDLQCEDAFVLYTNPMDDLFRIVEANPGDEKAMEYALSYLLLAKDMDNVVDFVGKWFGCPALRTLPTPVQECLLFYSDYYNTMDIEFAQSHGMSREEVEKRQTHNLDWCLSHGVTDENVNRFNSFKEKYGKAMRSQNPQSSLTAFRGTFWHYLLFTQITDNQ